MQILRKSLVKTVKAMLKARFKIKLHAARFLRRQHFIFISSPCWGNVGDHAIFLSQQKLLYDCGIRKNVFEVTSREYPLYKKTLIKNIGKDDVIMLDGGGNFGDTWPQTMERINDIVESFPENNVLIFPESWYFSETPTSKALLERTKEVFSRNKRVILYARDAWSYGQMKRHLPNTTVKQAFDCVLLLDEIKGTQVKKNGVGVCLRDDKEATGAVSKESVIKTLTEKNKDFFIVENDCYSLISKRKRKAYVSEILAKYKSAELIITDRFHGMIFSLLCNVPCIVIDNKTGKVRHFFEQIKDSVCGICVIETAEELMPLLSQDIIVKKNAFYAENIQKSKTDITETLLSFKK